MFRAYRIARLILNFSITLTVAVIGLVIGGVFAVWTSSRNTLRLSNTLEVPISRPPVGTGVVSLALFLGVSVTFGFSGLGVMAASAHAGALSLASFSGALAVGYFTMRGLHVYNSVFKIVPQVESLHLKGAKVYTITLPRSTDWQPEVAHRFMQQILHKLEGRLTFCIVAEKGRIVWQVADLRSGAGPSVIVQAIGALYPEADVSVAPLKPEPLAMPFYRYVLHFKQAANFIGPIRYLTDL